LISESCTMHPVAHFQQPSRKISSCTSESLFYWIEFHQRLSGR
jgi:hypothetical protein